MELIKSYKEAAGILHHHDGSECGKEFRSHELIPPMAYDTSDSEPKIEPFPICKTCGESFLGYSGDKFCIECENEGKTQTKRIK